MPSFPPTPLDPARSRPTSLSPMIGSGPMPSPKVKRLVSLVPRRCTDFWAEDLPNPGLYNFDEILLRSTVCHTLSQASRPDSTTSASRANRALGDGARYFPVIAAWIRREGLLAGLCPEGDERLRLQHVPARCFRHPRPRDRLMFDFDRRTVPFFGARSWSEDSSSLAQTSPRRAGRGRKEAPAPACCGTWFGSDSWKDAGRCLPRTVVWL